MRLTANVFRRLSAALALVMAVTLLPSLGRADSFWDWLKKDREAQKDFTEGRQPTNAPPPKTAPTPLPPPSRAPHAPERQADWLVMVYMAADNSLDDASLTDVQEMEKVGSSAGLKIVCLLDRAAGGDWSTTRRFLVRQQSELQGKHSWDPSLSTCQDLGELNTGDPETLRSFVAWARANHPANNTLLVLWNHGGGWRQGVSRAMAKAGAREGTKSAGGSARGVAWDDSSDGDFLETREVRTALAGFPPLSVLGCDACLMAMAEVAYEWRNTAAYFVGSELTEPNNGWPYDTVLKVLANQPATSPRDLAAQIVRLYGESYAQTEPVTQSAIDLNKLAPLAQSVDALAGALMAYSGGGGSLPADFWNVTSFEGVNESFVDLDTWLEGVERAAEFPPQIKAAATAGRARLAEALVANYSHPAVKGRGLSIYPGGGAQDQDYNGAILQFAADTRWDEFVHMPPRTKAAAGDDALRSGVPSDWLVMVYMAGDNSLDSATVGDVEEMEKVGSSRNLKIVCLLDRAAHAEWSTTRRFLVCKPALLGKHSWDPSLKTCEDLGELNMGDPETLRKFVAWSVETYPAAHTMLVLWNHGGGWRSATARAVGAVGEAEPAVNVAPLTRGIAWDESSGNDYLETREVRSALETIPRLSVIGCDACLMAMMEVVYEWRDRAAYFVGSEEVEPNDGWPYDTILKRLADDPKTEPKALAEEVVRQYGAYYKLRGRATQSAVDLAKVPALAKAFDVFAGALIDYAQNGGRIPDSLTAVPGFPYGDAEFLDLDCLLEAAEKNAAFGAAVQTAARDCRARFAEAIVANSSHADLKGRGLTVFPGGGSDAGDYNATIIQLARDTRWDEFLRLLMFQQGRGIGRGAIKPMPDRWAVLIGVAKYRDPDIPPLAYSVNDVVEMRDALIKQNGYDPAKVIVLTNAAATAENVRSTLGTTIPREVKEQDMVTIYFSGHGGVEPSVQGDSEDGTEKYLLLADSKVADMYGTAIPMAEMSRIFSRIRADKILFILDSCYSGATGGKGLMRGGMRAAGLTDDYLNKLAASKGTVVLTASRANEVSMESPKLRHGVFTFHILQALLGFADANGDGVTTLAELMQYIGATVSADSKSLGASQHPVMKGEVTGEFPIAIGAGRPEGKAVGP